MNPGELLSILTAKVASTERMPTGIPLITQDDVNTALGRIQDKTASLFLRVKYAQQWNFMQALDISMWMRVVDLWSDHNWPYPKDKIGKEFRHQCSRLAIIENIGTNICFKCGGVGQRVVTTDDLKSSCKGNELVIGQVIKCPACRGTGHKPPSDRSRARMLEMPRTRWTEEWSQRYREIQNLVDRVEAIGLGGIKKRLSA